MHASATSINIYYSGLYFAQLLAWCIPDDEDYSIFKRSNQVMWIQQFQYGNKITSFESQVISYGMKGCWVVRTPSHTGI